MKKAILTLTLALFMLPISGCLESLLQKAKPAQEIKNALVQLQSAYVSQDIDAIMDVYSEDYSGPQGEGKALVREFFNDIKDQGYLADTMVVLDDVVIEVDGHTATVSPVIYRGSWGQVDYKNTFKNEGSTWRIIAGEQTSY